VRNFPQSRGKFSDRRRGYGKFEGETAVLALAPRLICAPGMTTTAAAASPFQCVWIIRGSEGSVDTHYYALCGRYEVGPRVVHEEECASCHLWQPPPVLERRKICARSFLRRRALRLHDRGERQTA
jgi:hypothetical protein